MLKSFWYLFFILLFITAEIKGQNNLIISNSITYNTNKFSSDIFHDFDNATLTDKSQKILYHKIQREIPWETDSVAVNIFSVTYLKETSISKNQDLESLPEIFYTISTSRNKKLLTIFLLPFHKTGNGVNLIDKYKLMVTLFRSEKSNINNLKGSTKWADHSVLATGKWYKIKIGSSGIYKVTGAELSSMGFDISGLSFNNVRL
jgi:hypothetical protein